MTRCFLPISQSVIKRFRFDSGAYGIEIKKLYSSVTYNNKNRYCATKHSVYKTKLKELDLCIYKSRQEDACLA